MSTFKFSTLQMGSGWISGHVIVDEHYKWPDKKDGNNIHLNLDTDCFDEFSAEIDRLIAELEKVRQTAKKRFAAERAKTLNAIAEARQKRIHSA